MTPSGLYQTRRANWECVWTTIGSGLALTVDRKLSRTRIRDVAQSSALKLACKKNTTRSVPQCFAREN